MLKDWVKNIYVFDFVPLTVKIANKNLELNPKYKDKIHLYPFGLGKENTNVIIEMLSHRDGCNTMVTDFFDRYMPEEHQYSVQQSRIIKKSSEVLRRII